MKNKQLVVGSIVLMGIMVAGTVALGLRVTQIAKSAEVSQVAPGEPTTAGNLTLGQKFPGDLTVTDESGAAKTLGSFQDGEHFVVYTFHHPDCPCAANCAALISELGKAGYDDVRVVGIMVEGMDEERVMAALKEQHASGTIPFPVYFDHGKKVMTALGATRTPEIWLVDKTGTVRFWGAPENTLFPGSPGHRYYLREAVDALRQGKEPEVRAAQPIGCLIGG